MPPRNQKNGENFKVENVARATVMRSRQSAGGTQHGMNEIPDRQLRPIALGTYVCVCAVWSIFVSAPTSRVRRHSWHTLLHVSSACHTVHGHVSRPHIMVHGHVTRFTGRGMLDRATHITQDRIVRTVLSCTSECHCAASGGSVVWT